MKKAVAAVVSLSMSNPFSQFGLPMKFALDLESLEQAYRTSQLLTHPDQFVGKSALEQRLAAEQAIVLTNGYNRLKDPLLRAQIILKIKGIPVPGEQGATIPQSPLLLNVLEWREAIDMETNLDKLNCLDKQLSELYTQRYNDFDNKADDELAATYLELVYLQKTLAELYQKIKTLKD